MNKSFHNWLDSMNWQIDFYKKSFRKNRVDNEFDWAWNDSQKSWKEKLKEKLRPFLGSLYDTIRRQPVVPFTKQWFNEKSELLWNSRQLLSDELSKLLFDCHLLLAISDYTRYYYPRINFDDLISIQNEENFVSDLPKDYIGLPLKIFNIKLNGKQVTPEIKIISTKMQIELSNKYRQYFIKRGDVDFIPSAGEVVFDCGACIGDISMIFASLVGNSGEVHLFDPVPLHNRYCHLHTTLNPTLSRVLHINKLAVSNITSKSSGTIEDSTNISPGGCVVNNFETISLDDYVLKNNIRRVDYIKMDIEGSELAALQGASRIIRDFKPKLAISTYHKADDLWEIPALILKLNPKYKIYFGQHNPKFGEAVYYAA